MNFQRKSIGCFLYALFYTFCLYQNRSGITVPFFVGGTLYFFGSYLKKYGATPAKGSRFLMASLMLLGLLTCTTDSDPLITLNRLMSLVLFAVWLLSNIHEDSTHWQVGTWCRTVFFTYIGSFGQLDEPFWDARAYHQERHAKDSNQTQHITRAILLGIAAAVPILLVLLVLLTSADAIFCSYLEDEFWLVWNWLFSGWSAIYRLVQIALLTAFVGLYTYALMTYLHKKELLEKVSHTRTHEWDACIAITCTALILLLYVVFDVIQIFGLFLGTLSLPEGYTYASYAREGFFPLLFVCLFNICYVPFCRSFFKKTKALDVLLLAMCACTYIMLASSAYRMLLYVGSYSLTFLRLFVLWALVLLALLMAGVMMSIVRAKFPMFRYLLTVVTVGYLAFAAAHPDYWIARYNISQAAQGRQVDVWYLTRELSADAAPALISYENNEQFLLDTQEKIEAMHLRNWNASIALANYLIR